MSWPPADLRTDHVDGEEIEASTDNEQADAINQLVAHVVAGPDTPVGGDLTGSLPSPSLGAGVVLNEHVGPAAGIDEGKLALATPTSLIAGLIKIAEIDAGGLTTIDFASIPATYAHLKLITSLRTDATTTFDDVVWAFNSDTTDANYDLEGVQFGNTTTTAAQAMGTSGSRRLLSVAGDSAAGGRSAAIFSTAEVTIPNYKSTAQFKLAQAFMADYLNRASGSLLIRHVVMGWANTAAINRITIVPAAGTHFKTGSHASLYGILAGA